MLTRILALALPTLFSTFGLSSISSARTPTSLAVAAPARTVTMDCGGYDDWSPYVGYIELTEHGAVPTNPSCDNDGYFTNCSVTITPDGFGNASVEIDYTPDTNESTGWIHFKDRLGNQMNLDRDDTTSPPTLWATFNGGSTTACPV